MKGIFSLLVVMAGCMVMLAIMTSATLTVVSHRHHRHQPIKSQLASQPHRFIKAIRTA